MKKFLAILFLAPRLTWGAMDFDGSTGYGESASPDATAVPLSMCCWFNTDNDTGNQSGFSLSRSATSTERFRTNIAGGVAGDPIRIETTNAGTTSQADSSTGYTATTWHHLCGVFAAADSRSAYIDGGSKVTDTNTRTPVNIDQQNLGVTWTGATGVRGAFYDGRLAECGIWSVALGDAEVASLAKGFAPPCVRRGSLVSYYPMVNETTVLSDPIGDSNPLTISGTVIVADHPRVINCQ